MAFALFGRTGQELLPLLDLGSQAMANYAAISKRVNFVPDKDQREELEKYKISWLTLGLAAKGFTDELGAKLTPVLRPVIDYMREWIGANKDWLTSKITDEIRYLRDYLLQIDWNQVINDTRDFVRGFRDATEAVGGLRRIIEILVGLKVAGWILRFGSGLLTLIARAREAKEAFVALKAAAEAAGGAEAFGPLIATLMRVGRLIAPVAAFLALMTPTETAPPDHDEAPKTGPRASLVRQPNSASLSQQIYQQQGSVPNLWNLWGLFNPTTVSAGGANAAAQAALGLPVFQMPAQAALGLPVFQMPALPAAAVPSTSSVWRPAIMPPPSDAAAAVAPLLVGQAAASPPAPPRDSEVRVKIDINGLPSGSRVQTGTSGDAKVTSEVNVGYADPAVLRGM